MQNEFPSLSESPKNEEVDLKSIGKEFGKNIFDLHTLNNIDQIQLQDIMVTLNNLGLDFHDLWEGYTNRSLETSNNYKKGKILAILTGKSKSIINFVNQVALETNTNVNLYPIKENRKNFELFYLGDPQNRNNVMDTLCNLLPKNSEEISATTLFTEALADKYVLELE